MTYPEIDPVFFSLGQLQIRWYALAYIAGILLGWYYLTRLLKRPQLWDGKGALQTEPPISKVQLDDVLFYVTLGIILGGRLGFVLFYRPELIWAPFSEWPTIFGNIPIWPPLAIWTGGMSFHGGFLGVMIATFYFTRKGMFGPITFGKLFGKGLSLSHMRQQFAFFFKVPPKINALALGDLFACAAPIGLLFGRIANFINAELYGRPTEGPMGVYFPRYYSDTLDRWVYGPLQTEAEPGTYIPEYTREDWLASGEAIARHPSQLYEAFLEGVVLFIIIRIAVTRFTVLRLPGMATGLFVAGYGVARFFVEFFREPDGYDYAGPLGFLTRGMQLSLLMVLPGIWFIWRAWNQRKKTS